MRKMTKEDIGKIRLIKNLFLSPDGKRLGFCDYCLPVAQSMELYTALHQLGVPSRMVLFGGDSHTFHLTGKLSHRVRRQQEILSWLSA